MDVRILGLEDISQCLTLRLEALKTNPEAFGSSYEEESASPTNKYLERLQSTSSFIFGAFENVKLVGMVGLVKETRLKLRHKVSIVGMYVTPKERGSGIGRTLICAALNKAKTLEGIEQVNLTVVSTNVKAKKLYSSLGFQIYGTEKNALKIGRLYYDEDFMALFL